MTETTSAPTPQKSGLSTTSFVLALIGIFSALTLIFLPLGALLFVLALIFGIIALAKSQRKRSAITGIVLSSIGIISTACFMVRISQNVVAPFMAGVSRIGVIITKDAELQELLKNDRFEDVWNDRVEEVMKLKGAELFNTMVENNDFNVESVIKSIFDVVESELYATKEAWNAQYGSPSLEERISALEGQLPDSSNAVLAATGDIAIDGTGTLPPVTGAVTETGDFVSGVY